MMKQITILFFALIITLGVNAQSAFLAVSTYDMNFDISGGEDKITVTTNIPSWSFSGGTDWLFVSKNKNTLTVRCFTNTGDVERKAEFVISAMDQSVKVQVTQKAKEVIFLNVTPNEISFNDAGGQKTITVETNSKSWMISEMPYWCSAEIFGNSATLTCSANTTTTDREQLFRVNAGEQYTNLLIKQKAKLFLDVSPNNVEFGSSGGEKTITINTNTSSWNLSGLPNWCSAQKSGSSIILKCMPNEQEVKRESSFYVNAESQYAEIQIKQKANLQFDVSARNVDFESSGGQKTITVNTNLSSWNISKFPNWCSVEKSNNTITIICEPNLSNDMREGHLYIDAGEQSIEIQIKQKVTITLNVLLTDIKFDDIGGEKTIAVSTNAATWDISKKSDWCAIEKSEYGFILVCSPNTQYDDRNYVFDVTAGDQSVRVLVKQKGKLYLELSESVVEFDVSGGTKTFTVSTNASLYELSGEFSWCSKTVLDNLIKLDCKPNTSTNVRNDRYYVIAGDISKQVQVKQKALTFLEKGNWKRSLSDVMFNVSLRYENGKYKGELIQKKEREDNRIITSNIRNGLGVYFYIEKDSYWGEFRQGDSDGKGIFIIAREGEYYFPGCSKCRYYAGNWAFDMKNGIGRCYDKTGAMIYYGDFYNDKPTETYPQSHDDTYKFEYIEYSNAEKYLGETKNGKKEGLGILFFENGDAWYGEWKENKQNGNGIDLLFEGGIKTGKWKDGIYLEE